jgi:dihydrofolate reductase
VHGSAQLAGALHTAGLVDEYRLLTFPVSVGAGKRLCAEDAPPAGIRLLESRTTSMGVIYAILAPIEFTTGVAAVEAGREAV